VRWRQTETEREIEGGREREKEREKERGNRKPNVRPFLHKKIKDKTRRVNHDSFKCVHVDMTDKTLEVVCKITYDVLYDSFKRVQVDMADSNE